jgi:hypothetical protein
MKVKISKLIAFACLVSTASAGSQTIDWASLTGSQIVDSEGEALDNTFVFELGAFTAGFTPNESNLGDWGSYWHVFDTAEYSNNSLEGGYFTGSQNLQNVTNYSTLFQGMAAYIWIRNGSETEYFLANASAKLGISEWKFPELDANCCANGEVTTWSVSNLDTDTPVWGSQLEQHGGGEHDASGGPYDIQTHAVPEPAAPVMMLFVCGLGLLRRRR